MLNPTRQLDLCETADFIEAATITQTIHRPSFVVHIGHDDNGLDFVLVNDATGQSTLTHPS